MLDYTEADGVVNIRLQSPWCHFGQSITALVAYGTGQFNSDGELTTIIIPLKNFPAVVRSWLVTSADDSAITVGPDVAKFRIRPSGQDDTDIELNEQIVVSFSAGGRLREIEVF